MTDTQAPPLPGKAPVLDRAGAATRRLRTAAGDPARGVFLALAVTLVVGWIVVALDGGQLFTETSTVSMLQRSTALGIVAVGQTLVILAGSLDLSVAYLVSLSTLVAAETMAGRESMVLPAILAVLAVSAAVGLVNGVLIARLRINAFIATLGVGLLIKGYLENGYTGPAGDAATSFVQLAYTRIGPIPVWFAIMMLVAVVFWFVVRRTTYGHHLIAVGGDADVARLSGVRNDRVMVLTHVLCSVCAGLAGLYLAGLLDSGAPRVGTESGYDLESIAAVVLGGTALAGGRGGVAGTIGGVLLLAVLDSIFNQLQVDSFFKQMVRGVVIVVAVAVYARRLRQRGQLRKATS